MHIDPEDLGTLQAVFERFQKYRLPRLLELRDKVDEGGVLEEFDLTFLEKVRDDLRRAESYADNHKEFQHIVSEVIFLHHHITEKGLENQLEKTKT